MSVSFSRRLLSWYQKHRRDLPWRQTQDPYAIWISEIMLQQTQVATVIPYYERWLKRFPTIFSLARAPLSEVLKYWAGLGYYRRARMLHEGAQKILTEHGGAVPSDPAVLVKLPGIGRYTAGAIASIAFRKKAAVLDGNVIRVLSRLLAFKDPADQPKALQKLWAVAESLVPEKNPGDHNQAMMELGATICVPENPLCTKCPVRSECKAYAQHKPEDFPVKSRKEQLIKKQTVALFARNNGKILLQKQPKHGRWGGLWTLPFWERPDEMLKGSGLDKKDLKPALTLQHGFTKYQIRLKIYEALRPDALSTMRDWIPISRIPRMAFPSPYQKALRALLHGKD